MLQTQSTCLKTDSSSCSVSYCLSKLVKIDSELSCRGDSDVLNLDLGKMETKLEEQHGENNQEEDDIVIKDFDDVFDFIGGWGPFQVKVTSIIMNIPNLNSYTELIEDFLPPVPDNSCLLSVQHLPRLRLPLTHTHLVYSSTLVKNSAQCLFLYFAICVF